MKLNLILKVVLFSQLSFASCGNPENVLTFANGMFNDHFEAQASLDNFRVMFIKQYPQTPIHLSYLAYNTNEAALYQLYEVYTQYISSTGEGFWKNMAKVYPFANENLKHAISDQASHNTDLNRQIMTYQSFVDRKYKIVTVAHSQGNFYTLSSFNYFNSPRTKMVSVATPAHAVFDNGPYFTFKTDPIGALIPLALEPNLTKTHASQFDHGFLTHYLTDANAKTKILNAAHQAFTESTDSMVNYSFDEHDGHFNSDMRNVLRWMQSTATTKNLEPAQEILAATINEMALDISLNCEDRNYRTLTEALVQKSMSEPQLNPYITQSLALLKTLQFK